MSDVVTGAIIGAAAVLVGGVVTGVIDLKARKEDRASATGTGSRSRGPGELSARE